MCESNSRAWAAPPETSDRVIRAATGRGWDQWCDLIEASRVAPTDHSAIVAYAIDNMAVAPENIGWWAQGVAVGFERITGVRLPHQMPDGTFTANRSKTIQADVQVLREALLDDDARRLLFPGENTTLRSRPTSKTIRLGVGPGIAGITIKEGRGGRITVVIAHEKLPRYDDVERWKSYWEQWLAGLERS